MAEPPRAPPKSAGDEANAEAPEKTKGESDPLFHPTGLKRRTTVMGLAPAPHLGGLSGSPGERARAEEEARKQRVAARLSSSRPQPLAPAVSPQRQQGASSSAPPPLQEELIEPLPHPYTGPPPPLKRPNATPIMTGPSPIRTGAAAASAQSTLIVPVPHELREQAGHTAPIRRGAAAASEQRTVLGHGPPGTTPTGPPPPTNAGTGIGAAAQMQHTAIGIGRTGTVPNAGTTTLLMTPQTPQVPLTLPNKRTISDELPEPSGWEGATPRDADDIHDEIRDAETSDPGMPSAPTVLVEPSSADAAQYSSSHPPPAKQSDPVNTPRIGADPRATARIEPHRIRSVPPAPATPTPPITERILHAAAARAARASYASSHAPAPPPSSHVSQPPYSGTATPTIATPNQPVHVASTALAVRPYEPPHARHSVSGPLDRRLVLLNEPDSARAAGFRSLRDSLLGKSLPRVVAISSAAPHEGKTTCAINLALALAEQPTTKVLLLDGNFYQPELAQIFHLDRLGDVTPSESWLEPYKIGAITSSLHVAGIVRSEASRSYRFEQHKFDTLVDRLCRVSYDYLIIDTPALRDSQQAGSLVASADGTVLAVRSGKTTAAELRRAAAQIPANKALGIALMDA